MNHRYMLQPKCRFCESPVKGFGDVCCDPEFDPEQVFRDGEMFAVEAVIIQFPGEVAQ